MIFIIFLIPVVLLFGTIYWYDSANEMKVREYLAQHQCKNVTVYRARYKAVCQDSVIVIKDFFFLDFDSNVEVLYKDIASLEKIGNAVVLNKHKDTEFKVYFENEKDANSFENNIKEKLD